MGMIELVATRLMNLHRARNGLNPCELSDLNPDDRRMWREDARAAVEALREPGDKAIDEGARCCNEEDDTGAALAVWTTMIDAILAEKA